jgi:K(+)-stimulated pyrophosphate-energized sodium pump
MMLPGAIAIVSPLIIGFLLGAEVLGGFLAGATVSGVLMGMFQNNAGGAWDNAKKSFEKGVEINGKMEYKKSEPHKASVTGDTVGDPFKDTSGPSMNILIKLMSIVSLVIAPTLSGMFAENIQKNRMEKLETMMTACKKAGCTEEQCANLGAGASCCTTNDAACEKECGGTCDKATCEKPCCASKHEGGIETVDEGLAAGAMAAATTSLKLADNTEINVAKGSLEDQMMTFFSGAEFNAMSEEDLKTKWFDFNSVKFNMGSAEITEDSKAQLNNLSAILKANPTMKLKVGGYTDKTGNEDANVKLSKSRADAIKTFLNTAQIVEAEGYGSKFATVDANASDAEREKDRKMSVRFTK